MKHVITILAAGLLAVQAAPQPALQWDGTNAIFFSDNDGPFTLGIRFRADRDLTVTSLGAFDYLGDGLATAHTVGIWSVNGGAPLASATVPAGTAAPLVGVFRYATIPNLVLCANTEYVVGASDFYGQAFDIYPWKPQGVATAQGITLLAPRATRSDTPGLVFPPYEDSAWLEATANFQFSAQVLTTNLLTNPGAETGDLTGWSAGGQTPPVVASTNNPGPGTIPPHSGQFVFKGGPNPNGFLQQRVILLDRGLTTNQIDTGRLFANVSFWQRSYCPTGASPPIASVTLVFRDQQGASIEGYISTLELAALGAYTNHQERFGIPSGTRSIDYMMAFFTSSGASGDSYIDDNSLTVSDDNAAETIIATIQVAAVDVCWTSRTNTLYQVEYRSSLTTNLCTPLGSPTQGTGGTDCVTDWVRGQPQRFYRVRTLP
jgi:hypothetical protein